MQWHNVLKDEWNWSVILVNILMKMPIIARVLLAILNPIQSYSTDQFTVFFVGIKKES